ncbi:hypothetical protein UFOVP71_198 [uncultured Caudovirales phage]|uniref:Uncharacterized protein n=1 Tax=uncultured Caudovirales phage TaxID=2100421 RepID=A0A6J5TDE7_9CAUD|nr:hypothetical protein UFOVP71_198 [uncultured Caudovirales phage]
MFTWIKNLIGKWQAARRYKKRIKEMRKRDPFIY